MGIDNRVPTTTNEHRREFIDGRLFEVQAGGELTTGDLIEIE